MGLRRDSVETGSFFSNWLAGVLWLTEACLPTAVVLRVALMIAAVVAEAFIGTALDCDRSGRIAFRVYNFVRCIGYEQMNMCVYTCVCAFVWLCLFVCL